MTDRYTCHAEILVEKIDYPDPDGEGRCNGVKGEIRLMKRRDALAFERHGAVRILSAKEAEAAGLE